jgi:hypothetical protein
MERMSGRVAALRHAEPVEVDADRLDGFCRRRGADAEAQIADHLGQLDRAVADCEWEYGRGEPTGVARSAAMVHEISAELGMVTLERAALNLLDCLAREDPVGLAACAARLFRVSDACERSEWTLGSAASGGDASA